MKKTLSLVLAAVLAFGSAVSAFAAPIAPADTDVFNPDSGNFIWSSDDGRFEAKETVKYGDTVGFLVGRDNVTSVTTTTTTGGALNANVKVTGDIATDKDEIKNLKAYPAYKIPNSSTIVEKVAVEYKKYLGTDPVTSKAKEYYAYFVTMKIKSNPSASSTDLYGEMFIGSSKTNAENRGGVAFELSVGYETETGDDAPRITSSNQVINFKELGDVEITWGPSNGNDIAVFTVDATGQSKLNVGYTTKYNSEFSAKYPAANLEFLTFGAKPSFNRIGELTIYSEDGKYLYEITADGFKEPKYTYDEDYEAFVLKTRTLGAYVISDIELEPEVVEEKPAPSVPGQNPPTGGTSGDVNNGGKPNPNTGR